MPFRLLDEEPEKLETEIPPKKPTKVGRFRLVEEEEPVAVQQTPTTKTGQKIPFIPWKPKPKPVGLFEGISNSARNAFASSQQALSVTGGVTPEEAQEISKIEYEKNARQASPDYKAYQEAEGWDAVNAFINNPVEITTNIVAEGLAGSLPSLGAGLAAGGVGAAAGSVVPGVGTGAGFIAGQVAGTFAGSLATEYGSKVLEELQNEGMNLSDPNSITEFFSNQQLVDKAKDKALKRGVPIAAFDAVSAGLGGKVGKILGTAFKTKTREATAELAIQAGLGGGGEVVGSLVAGDEIDPKAVFSEVVGELGPGSAEIAIGKAQQVLSDRRKQRQVKQAAETAEKLENSDAPLTADALKTTVAKNIVEQEKQTADKLDEDLAGEVEKVSGMQPIREEEEFVMPPKEEFKASYAKLTPESLAETEASFQEQLQDEDADTRAFAQTALEALAEFKAGQTPVPTAATTPTPITPSPAAAIEAPVVPAAIVEPVAAQEAQVYESLGDGRFRSTTPPPENAVNVSEFRVSGEKPYWTFRLPQAPTATIPAAEVPTPITPEPIVVTPEAEPAALVEPTPVAPVEAETAASLSRVADNTATDEEVVRLARQGLVNIQDGQNVITPRGEEVIQRAGAPLPRLTPEERAAEVAAAPAAIVEQAPPVAEAPAVTPAPVEPVQQVEELVEPVQQVEELVSPPNINDPKYRREDGSIDLERYDADEAAWYASQGQVETVITEERRKLNEERNAIKKEIANLEKQYERESRKRGALPPAIRAESLKKVSDKITAAEVRLEEIEDRISAPVTTPPVTEAVTPAEAPAITPAPVAETPPVTEAVTPAPEIAAATTPAPVAPAAEVAPIQRDITKPEQMTPEEVLKDAVFKKDGQRWGVSFGGREIEGGSEVYKDAQGVERVATLGAIRFKTKTEAIAALKGAHSRHLNFKLSKSEPVSAAAIESYGITLPEGYTKQGDLYVYQPTPAVSETITPAAEPAGISVGNRVKYGTLINPYVVEEILPQTEAEKREGNQYYRIRSEKPNKNGKYDIADVETKDIKPLQSKSDKRYNPLGYDIADVVGDVNAGKTDTPLRAINQVVEDAAQLRNRVRAESERRQQPRKRGKAAILERIARERSAGNITEQTAQSLTDFVNRIRPDAIGDTAISIREKGVSNYDFADNLVTFFLSQDKDELGRSVAVHEFWHGLSRFLPESEVNQINQDYVRELETYIKKNPWFLAFVGRYTLTPEQYEAYKKFNPKEAETKLTPILDDQGNIVKYKIKFDKENYRYIMLDEFIAEKMTDLVIGKQAIPNTFLGKLAKAFREFLALIKARLGKNPYEKFYQLVTDENQRMSLQRESGVAPAIQIYEPQEYDYSTRRAMMAVEPTAEAAPAEKPARRTKMQSIIDISTGVKRPRTKLTVDEMAALKDQIRIGARKRREDKQTQKEFAKDVTEYLRGMAIRGKVSAPQLRAVTSKAMQTQFDNEASIKSFINYANKVIENANYNRDISDAKAAIKTANKKARQKEGSSRIKAKLKELASFNPNDIEPEDMSPRQIEVDGEIITETPVSVAEYTAVLKEYMASLGPVTAEGFRVIPEAEIIDFTNKVRSQVASNADARNKAAFAEKLQKALDNKAMLPSELEAITQTETAEQYEEHLKRKGEEREKIEKAITELAMDTQSNLVTYDDSNLNADELQLVNFLRALNIADMRIGDRKNFVMVANNIIVNNDFSGAQKFEYITRGQLGAAQAAKDSQKVKRGRAMVRGPYAIFDLISGNLGTDISIGMQSLADTVRNITSSDKLASLLYHMGFGEIETGRAKSMQEKEKIQNAVQVRLDKIQEKNKQQLNDPGAMTTTGIAATLIQTTNDETEAEGIKRMRGLVQKDIEKKKGSWKPEDRKEAIRAEKALKDLDADSVEGILAQLEKLYPANYDTLMFFMNDLLPAYKESFKKHDEMFNNQTDNYDNPYYLPIKYRTITTEIKDPGDGVGNQMIGVSSPKQSKNSIKRVKNTVLPENMTFDYNLVRNVMDSLSGQLDAMYMNPGLQQLSSFLKSENAIEGLGGAENLEVMKRRANMLANARERHSYDMTPSSRLFDSIANFVRKIGSSVALGGFTQAFKQMPDQMITTFVNVGDNSITLPSLLETREARDAMMQFSIGMRGEIAGGAKWINQLDNDYANLEKYFKEGLLAKVGPNFDKINDAWLFSLKFSDSFAAAHGWISYYKQYLKKNGIPFTNWDNETKLIASRDESRVKAGLYADNQVDTYQGSSDPTKMAQFAQRGRSGGENLLKTMILPFSSFVIQQRARILTDLRNIIYGNAEERAIGARGLTGTIFGIIAFHSMRRYALPVILGFLTSQLYGLLGIDMDEPDEEEEQKKKERVLKQFISEIATNITLGGYSAFAEAQLIDKVNLVAYAYDKLNQTDNIYNEEGKELSWEKYRETNAPLYRYTGPGADSSLGMVGIIPEQLGSTLDKLKDIGDEELMDSLTDEEQNLLVLAAFSETLLTFRLNDTDVARLINRMTKEVKDQAKEREKEQRKLMRAFQ